MARAIIALTLVLATVGAYWGVWNNAFLHVDDPYYVTDEPMVTRGLSRDGLLWAFTTSTANNYHPLTWLAHMLDCQLFGTSARAHHAVNLALHLLNSLLLLVVFHRLTNALWSSAFIAAVFALHPLHVESVAWVAERKDVLSTCFGLLTILAYAAYTRNPTPLRYVLVFVLLALGLLAKPMLVTWPFVLMLLDVWPLGRSTLWRPVEAADDTEVMTPLELLLEKLPLLLLTVIFAGTTMWAQGAGGAVASRTHLPLLARVFNPLMSYGRYALKTFWPDQLAFYYPYSGVFPLLHLVLCAGLLALGTFVALRWLRIHPWLAVGWFWFVGTLIPVIGIVQVGGQAIADRYMYVPMIGLTIIIAWAAREYLIPLPKLRPLVVTIAVMALIALAVRTQRQVRYWRNSVTLALYALSITDNNFFAHVLAGSGYAQEKDIDSALMHFEAAEKLMPGKYTKIIEDLRIERERTHRNTPALP